MSYSAHFSALTLAEAWELSILGLLDEDATRFVDSSTGGPARELTNVLLNVAYPRAEPRISPHYPVPELVADYADLFARGATARTRDAETIADRIFSWPTPEGPLDQVDVIVDELRRHAESRRGVIEFWDPARDLLEIDSTPLGHCLAWMTVREMKLDMTLVSRSVDAWVGMTPNMIGFVSLMQTVAEEVGVAVGAYSHLILSYHLYTRDLPAARQAFGNGP